MDTNEAARNQRWYNCKFVINFQMLPCKLAYFFEYAKEASYWPYLVLFYVSIGLDTAQAGLIAGLRFIGGVLGAPACGWVADKSGRHTTVAIFVCSLSAIFNCLQPIVTMLLGDHDRNSCPIKYNNTTSNWTGTAHEVKWEGYKEHSSTNDIRLFYSLLTISMVAAFFDGSTMALVDSGVLRRMLTYSESTDIGQHRFFGPVGYGLSAFLSSILIDYYPHVSMTCYSGVFFNYLLTCIGSAVNFYFLFKDVPLVAKIPTTPATNTAMTTMSVATVASDSTIMTTAETLTTARKTATVVVAIGAETLTTATKASALTTLKAPATPMETSQPTTTETEITTTEVGGARWGGEINSVISAKLKEHATWMFLLIVFFQGLLLALLYSFAFLFLKELKTPSILLGASMVVNSTFGCIFFIISHKIVNALGGLLNAMAFSMFCWCVRYLIITYMKHPYQFLLACTLNGFNSSLFVVSYIGFIKANFPTQTFTVICGVVTALYNSGGYFIANIVGGKLYKEFGAKILFLACSIASGCFSLLILCYAVAMKGSSKRSKIINYDNIDKNTEPVDSIENLGFNEEL